VFAVGSVGARAFYNRTMADLHTAAQIRRIDHAAIVHGRISGLELMQRAAEAAFACLVRRWPAVRRVLVLAGTGNNGGDALLVAERALRRGLEVEVIGLPGARSGDAVRACGRFHAAGGVIQEAAPDTSISRADVVVDGLFGTGLSRPIEGIAARLVQQINETSMPVLALDVPSGLDADTGAPLGPCVRADATITFVGWKRGLFTGDALDLCGTTELATLDVPARAFADVAVDAQLIETSILDRLPARPRNALKGLFGHVLVIGGDLGMGGAARLCGEAALRCGAGLVSVATRSAHRVALHAGRPELMVRGVDDAAALAALFDGTDVLALGPGLGRADWGRALWNAALDSARPAVIDADALNLLAASPRALPAGSVLTPHPGEAARLLGCAVANVQADRYAAVRELASRHAAVVILKGAGSLVGTPDGSVAVCRWGNPGMASGGMGDVLTGVVAALLGQGLDARDAACIGVALHARAGDLAAGSAPRGLLASDLFEPLRQLVNGMDRG
jgi:NAD(P)H-hydrate epimerase